MYIQNVLILDSLATGEFFEYFETNLSVVLTYILIDHTIKKDHIYTD